MYDPVEDSLDHSNEWYRDCHREDCVCTVHKISPQVGTSPNSWDQSTQVPAFVLLSDIARVNMLLDKLSCRCTRGLHFA